MPLTTTIFERLIGGGNHDPRIKFSEFCDTDTVDFRSILKDAYTKSKSDALIKFLAGNKPAVKKSKSIFAIPAYTLEEALVVKSILKEEYSEEKLEDILSSAVMSKNIRIFELKLDKEKFEQTPFTTIAFERDGTKYISIFLLWDFLNSDDTLENGQGVSTMIRGAIALELAMALYDFNIKDKIPMNKLYNRNVIVLPSDPTPTDSTFILYYHAYLLKTIAAYFDVDTVKATIEDNISPILPKEVISYIYDNLDVIIDAADKKDLDTDDYTKILDALYFINGGYYQILAQIQQQMTAQAQQNSDDNDEEDEGEEDDEEDASDEDEEGEE